MNVNRLALSLLLGFLVLGGSPAGAQTARPDSSEVEFLLFEGGTFLEEGKILEAIGVFAQAVTLDPERTYTHLLYAQALTRGLLAGLFSEPVPAAQTAARHYQAVLDREPRNREAMAGIQLLSETFLHREPPPVTTEAAQKAWVRGQESLEAGNFKAAAAAFQEAATLEPKVGAAHRALGEALRRDSRFKEAERAFKRALDLDSQDLIARVGLARTLEDLQKPKEALDAYREAYRLEPTHTPAAAGVVRVLGARDPESLKIEERLLLGQAYLTLERYDAAAEELNRVLEERGGDFAARKALGIVDFFRQRDDASRELLEAILKEDPENLEVLYYLGALALRGGDLAKGEDYLGRLLALDPVNPNAQRLLGFSLLDQPDRAQDALRFLTGAHAAGAQIEDFPCVVGTLFMRLGQYFDASEALQDCIAGNPDFAGAYLGLGMMADDRQQTREAIDYLERYLELAETPDRAAIFRLGVAYLRSGQDAKGYETLREIVQPSVEAGSDSALTEVELLEATSFFLSTIRRFNDAIFIGELLLTRDSENSIYNNNLAMTYADADQKPGRAHALAVKATKLAPDNPGHLDTLGWALLRLGRYEEAETTLLESLERARAAGEVNLSEIYYHLGVLYSRLDRHQEALDYLVLAAENPPSIFLAQQIDVLLEAERERAGSR